MNDSLPKQRRRLSLGPALIAALVLAALVPALLVIAGVVMVSLQMPGHPRWMAVAGLLLPIPAALLGATLARTLRHR